MHYQTTCLLSLIVLSLQAALPSQAQTLTVAWRIKPPHQYLENGKEKGNLLELTKRVFADSKIPARFVDEPAKRIWQNFANGRQNYCSFGWYKIPEREALVQYSDSIYRDPPHLLLVGNSELDKVQAHRNLKSLLTDTSLSLAIVDGVSYGTTLDQLFADSQNKIIRSSAAPMIMARMVNASRASMMVIDREDWLYLSSKEEKLNELTQVDIDGMPPGLDRYIICSNDVPPIVMNKINASLAKISAKTKSNRP